MSSLTAEAQRQALLLKGATEESEALDFIEAAFDNRESHGDAEDCELS